MLNIDMFCARIHFHFHFQQTINMDAVLVRPSMPEEFYNTGAKQKVILILQFKNSGLRSRVPWKNYGAPNPNQPDTIVILV